MRCQTRGIPEMTESKKWQPLVALWVYVIPSWWSRICPPAKNEIGAWCFTSNRYHKFHDGLIYYTLVTSHPPYYIRAFPIRNIAAGSEFSFSNTLWRPVFFAAGAAWHAALHWQKLWMFGNNWQLYCDGESPNYCFSIDKWYCKGHGMLQWVRCYKFISPRPNWNACLATCMFPLRKFLYYINISFIRRTCTLWILDYVSIANPSQI